MTGDFSEEHECPSCGRWTMGTTNKWGRKWALCKACFAELCPEEDKEESKTDSSSWNG